MTSISKVGVLAHPLRPHSFPLAKEIAHTLKTRGVQAWSRTVWQEDTVDDDVQSVDMVIAIGGDGAMLRAARVCAAHNIPVLGINMGQLGFLTEIQSPDQWPQYIERLLQEDYWIETRALIHAEIIRADDTIAKGEALNDFVISGDVFGRMIQLDTYIDGDWATSYYADGLVVATATGSTAYALSLGGPILPPELRNILIVPIAPHLSMNRPIVLAEGAQVDILPADKHSPVVLVGDGQPIGSLENGDRVRIRMSERTSHFIRLRERHYFYRSLLDRLEPRVRRPGTEAPEQSETV